MRKVLILAVLMLLIGGCDDADVLIAPGDVEIVQEAVDLVGRRRINREEVEAALSDKVSAPESAVFFADVTYLEYSVAEIRAFLATNRVDEYEPLHEFRDCDDYARMLLGAVTERFPGIPFGIVWLWKITIDQRRWVLHSQNIFYDGNNGEVYLVEPVNDQMQIIEWRVYSNFILMDMSKN